MKLVIICGGVGTKMWPLSRSKLPKHFIPLIGKKSLFQINYETLRKVYPARDIYVQTTIPQAKIAGRQVTEIPRENYFIEPETRNTGPANGFMAMKLFRIAPDEPFMIIQADDLRDPQEEFLKMIEVARKLVEKDGKLVTGGFHPTGGVMGVDYMVLGDKVKTESDLVIYKMKKWVWRDSKEENEKRVKNSDVFLHTNHYTWTPRRFLEAYQKWAPEWYEPLVKITKALGTKSESKVIKEEYVKMPIGPGEKVTQHALEEGYVIKLNFGWFDFGTWESYADFLAMRKMYDNDNNHVMEMDGKNNFVWAPNKFVTTIGLENIVIVDTGDALLVARKDQTGKVGQVVEKLKEMGKRQLY